MSELVLAKTQALGPAVLFYINYRISIFFTLKRDGVCHRVGEYKNSSFLKLSIKFLEWFPAACTSTCTLKIKAH